MNGEDWSLKMEGVDGSLNMGIKEWAWTLGQRCKKKKKKPKKHRKLKSLKTTIRNGFETIFYVYNYIYIYII